MDEGSFSGPVLAEGRGSVVRDVNGREYLDHNSGQMCSALGHSNPTVVDAIKEICDTLIHARTRRSVAAIVVQSVHLTTGGRLER
mgnify:FL=1